MAISKNNNKWQLPININSAETKTYEFATAGKYLDSNIKIDITVPEAVLDYSGGNLQGGAITNNNIKVSSTNNGISITREQITSSAVTYNANANGYINVNNGDSVKNGSQIEAITQYLEGVRLAPSTTTRTFYIDVPNESNSSYISFLFSVAPNGNVTVTEGAPHTW